jgi:hypothetical protein
LTIVSPQVGVPVEHDVAPTWHALAGVQAAPEVQAMQAPLELHTMLVPHMEPAVIGVPVSAHTGEPVTHETKPTWHALDGVQAAPALQVTQLPLEQTMPLPQLVPSG